MSALVKTLYWFTQAHSGAVARSITSNMRGARSIKAFGVVGDGRDDTDALQRALDSGVPLYAPAGTYLYTELTGIAVDGRRIIGDGSAHTVFKCTGTGNAFSVVNDAAGFKQGITLSGFTVEGNAATPVIIHARKVGRCQWTDINVREANGETGIGFLLQGVMLTRFASLFCSQDLQPMVSAPSEGMRIEATALDGNSANNTFTSCYLDGAGADQVNSISVGLRILGGTQNAFIGGAAQSCKTWGVLIGTDCNNNTFDTFGLENLNAVGGDYNDGGNSSKLINCYGSHKVVLQGRAGELSGGTYERVQIDPGALRYKLQNLTINHWSSGAGGLFDSGTGTESKNIWDADAGAYLTVDVYPRFLLTCGATKANVTGAGAVYTVPWEIIFDDNENCDATSFVAPVPGRYQLNAYLSLQGLSTAATMATMEVVTPIRTYTTQQGLSPKVGGLQSSISMSMVADMLAGDSAVVRIQVQGMAGDTVSIIGHPVNMWSTFSGHKVE